MRDISDLQSMRNNSLGVDAPNNSVARTQGASTQAGGIVRESIAGGTLSKGGDGHLQGQSWKDSYWVRIRVLISAGGLVILFLLPIR